MNLPNTIKASCAKASAKARRAARINIIRRRHTILKLEGRVRDWNADVDDDPEDGEFDLW